MRPAEYEPQKVHNARHSKKVLFTGCTFTGLAKLSAETLLYRCTGTVNLRL